MIDDIDANTTSGSSSLGVRVWASTRMAPRSSTRPAAILVPPTSTANTTKPSDKGSVVAMEPTADPVPWIMNRGADIPVMNRSRDIVDTCFAHAPCIVGEHHGGKEHDDDAEESEHHRTREGQEHEYEGGHEHQG